MRATHGKLAVCTALLLVGFLLMGLVPADVQVRENRVVRIGWFEQAGYQQVDKDGQPCGYNYEYLMQIAQHTGWTYEFVFLNDFNACYTMLKNGELDLLGCVIYTPERAQTVSLPRLSCGMMYTSLFVSQSSPLAPYDYKAFDGMRVGCRPSQNPVDLLMFAQENNFSLELYYYSNTAKIEEAIRSGEVNAGVLGGYQCTPDTRIVASFAPTPFYFAITPTEKQLLRDLNRAMDAIHTENLFFDKELSYRYLPESKESLRLTQEELAYIQSAPVLTAAYETNRYPLTHRDPQTGEFIGIVADVFARIEEMTGLSFTYVDQSTLPKEDQPQVLTSFTGDFTAANAQGYHLTPCYFDVPITVVRNPLSMGRTENTAAPHSLSTKSQSILMGMQNFTFYDTAQECLDAVVSGEANQACIDACSASYILSLNPYRKLQTTTLQGTSYQMLVAVRQDMDEALCSILGKAIGQISQTEMSGILLDNTIHPQTLTLYALVSQMPGDLLLMIGLVLLLIVIVLIVLLCSRGKYLERIRALLYTDELTGLYNARGFEAHARHLLKTHASEKHFLIDFDINSFEAYNAINGYDAGDLLLKKIAAFSAQYCTKREVVARIQADHFVCLAIGENSDSMFERAQIASDRFRKSIALSSLLISYGIYEVTNPQGDVTAMRDCAMAAKRTVKGNYDRYIAVYDEEIRTRQLDNASIVTAFEGALEHGELVPFYQPQYDMHTKRIVGAEALVRWLPPKGGMIPPDRFISILERNGLIGKLDMFMFEQVCVKLKQLLNQYATVPILSVNLSRAHLYDIQFVSILTDIAARYSVPTACIEIELTETAFLDNSHELVRVMESLHRAGFLVAMDDFGSGYSSLNMLKEMRFDTIKIDKGFLGQSSGTQRGEVVIRNMLRLAQDLHLKTVAEGVETQEQYQFLLSCGCDVAQGYLFSRPIPSLQFDDLLHQQ